MKELFLAIEGGGTKTRVLLADADENVVAREVGGPASGLYIQRMAYARATRRILKRIQQAAQGVRGGVVAAALGGPMDAELVRALIGETLGPIEVGLYAESDIALAVYSLNHGISLVAGTGSSCRARNEQGNVSVCGGLGPQFGDDGSGYWIGRSGITAAMEAMYCFGEPTALVDRVRAAYNIGQPWEILALADRSGHVPGPTVAAFTPHVFDVARDGDAVALRICREAGKALGALVRRAASALRWRRQPVPLVLTGGVFNGGTLILRPLKGALSSLRFDVEVYPAVPEPSAGLVKLAIAKRKGRAPHW